MINLKNKACWLLTVVMTASAHAVAARYQITAEQVVEAANRAGLQATAAQVEVPGGVVASSQAPDLKVQSVRNLAGGLSIVRLECEAGKCLPFYVRVRSRRTGSAPQVAAAAPAAASDSVSIQAPFTASKRATVVRSGDQATLWLEGNHVHISVKVVCIDAGAVGEKVRARGSSNRQIYTAQVVESAVLRARL